MDFLPGTVSRLTWSKPLIKALVEGIAHNNGSCHGDNTVHKTGRGINFGSSRESVTEHLKDH